MPDAQWSTTRIELGQCVCRVLDEGRTYKVLNWNHQCTVHTTEPEQE